MLRQLILILITLTSLFSDVSAQDWANKVFSVRNHDFGSVAKNTKAEFVFEIENPYAVDLHIASVRTSCGCTTPVILKDTLTTYEKSGILAVYNTETFSGNRHATLTVTFDKPQYAEVQLTIKGNIRTDFEIKPGSIMFGAVDSGQEAEKRVLIQHRGTQNWQLVGVRGVPSFVDVQVRPGDQPVPCYEVIARLKKDAPFGFFQDQLTLVTNNSSSPHLQLRIDGRVVPPVTLSPASLFMGVVQPSQVVTKKIMVRSKQPFRILSIEPRGGVFDYVLSDKAQKLHMVSITFTAGEKTEKVVETIKIVTDLGGGVSATCQASAAVIESVASN
tara:strand:+ start:1371 stop:2363 length:993 start_codon:yes stop_codon:yes gene_type:complete